MRILQPYNETIPAKINDMLHQILAAGLQTREIYPELKKHFHKEYYNVTWEVFGKTTKFGLRIDTSSSTNNTLYSSGKAVEAFYSE